MTFLDCAPEKRSNEIRRRLVPNESLYPTTWLIGLLSDRGRGNVGIARPASFGSCALTIVPDEQRRYLFRGLIAPRFSEFPDPLRTAACDGPPNLQRILRAGIAPHTLGRRAPRPAVQARPAPQGETPTLPHPGNVRQDVQYPPAFSGLPPSPPRRNCRRPHHAKFPGRPIDGPSARDRARRLRRQPPAGGLLQATSRARCRVLRRSGAPSTSGLPRIDWINGTDVVLR
jgi:hypothetical protein